MLPPDLLRQPLASTGITKRSAFVRRFFRRDRRAFTLVEVLVSIVALTAFVLLVSQLVNSASTITTLGNKHMDADSQGRSVLDRMAVDFGQMVKRADVDCIFYKNATPSAINDAMFFYAGASAYFDSGINNTNKRSAALVGYRVNSSLQLERLGEGLTWDGATTNDAKASPTPTSNTQPGSVVSFSYPGAISNPAIPNPASTLAGNWSKTIGTAANNYTDGIDSDYHVISDQVYRLEIAFLLSDGSISTKPIVSTTPSSWPTGSSSPTYYNSTASDPTSTSDSNKTHAKTYAVGSRWFNTSTSVGYICLNAAPGAAVWSRIGIQDVSAIIVALAILDSTSQKIVIDKSKMVSALLDPTDADLQATPPKLMAQTWSSVVNSSTFAQTSGIPQAAASQVRVYQRYFYLNK